MRLSRLTGGLAFVVAPLAVATSVHANKPSPERAEVLRIQSHFDSVITELRARDVSALSDGQRANRAELVRTLVAYRDRGVFPHNYDFPGLAMPYFVDRKTGTLCAVAHLLESTGRRAIVDRVARTNNNVWVAELAGDSALGRWLDINGLTLAEAARIQVPYVEVQSPAQQARNTAFMVVGPLAVGGAAVTSVWNAWSNADGHRRSVSWTGVASGTLAIAAGSMLVTRPNLSEDARSVGVGATVVGGLSLLLSSQSIYRHRQIVVAEREASRKRVAEATVAPLVAPNAVGASVSLRF
ncbi:MAG TPA: hypothetical protein VIP11_18755 [Gemmatimonadaceae bacterium]